MSTYTLIIIDMQAAFDSSEHPALNTNIQIQIRKAIELGMHIVFVQYSGSGPVNPNLTELTQKYNKTHFVTKHNDDGSKELHNHFIENPEISTKTLIICGVNTDCCVRETICGLAPMYKILVPVNCCNTALQWPTKYYHSKGELPILKIRSQFAGLPKDVVLV